jgi:hypothetical protein
MLAPFLNIVLRYIAIIQEKDNHIVTRYISLVALFSRSQTRETPTRLYPQAGRRGMPTRRFTVLLVGKTSGNGAKLLDYLRRRGCVVRSILSYEEAAALLRNHKFDLVLSDFLISDGSAYRLIPLLSGTETSMFISNAVGGGCWWMNAIYDGQDRTKEPGMHPSEFKACLEHLLVAKKRGSEKGSEIKGNPTFVRHVVVVLIAFLVAFGIFLFGVFAHTQPRLTRSIVPTNPRSWSSYRSKNVQPRTPTNHTTRLRFYETEKEITI